MRLPAEDTGGQIQEPIAFEVYNAIISQLRPLDVRLLGLAFDVRPSSGSNVLQATASAEMPEVVEHTKSVDGTQIYTIEHRIAFSIEAPGPEVVGQGRAKFAVRIRLAFEPPENFWPIFLQRNVKLYTHPPMRDLVASLCGRANLMVELLGSVSVTQNVAAPSEADSQASARPTKRQSRKAEESP